MKNMGRRTILLAAPPLAPLPMLPTATILLSLPILLGHRHFVAILVELITHGFAVLRGLAFLVVLAVFALGTFLAVVVGTIAGRFLLVPRPDVVFYCFVASGYGAREVN